MIIDDCFLFLHMQNNARRHVVVEGNCSACSSGIRRRNGSLASSTAHTHMPMWSCVGTPGLQLGQLFDSRLPSSKQASSALGVHYGSLLAVASLVSVPCLSRLPISCVSHCGLSVGHSLVTLSCSVVLGIPGLGLCCDYPASRLQQVGV